MIELSWQTESALRQQRSATREEPEIIIGFGAIATALYHRLNTHLTQGNTAKSDGSNGNAPLLQGQLLLGNQFLAIKAVSSQLPWVDGLIYLRTQAANSRLYLPSNCAPNVPVPWLEAALKASQPPNAQTHDILYLPKTNTVIYADQYYSAAVAKQNDLLPLWYEQHSQTATALDG